MAAAEHAGWEVRRSHPAKAAAAERLQESFNLPDVSELLWKLNDARKATAYGDIDYPELDAKEVAVEIETYVDAVTELLGEAGKG